MHEVQASVEDVPRVPSTELAPAIVVDRQEPSEAFHENVSRVPVRWGCCQWRAVVRDLTAPDGRRLYEGPDKKQVPRNEKYSRRSRYTRRMHDAGCKHGIIWLNVIRGRLGASDRSRASSKDCFRRTHVATHNNYYLPTPHYTTAVPSHITLSSFVVISGLDGAIVF